METFHVMGMSKDSDEALVLAAKHGDTGCFEELVSRHKRKVFAIAQRITKNREDAEDVAQESFHKAFLHLAAFQEKYQFSTWLTRIAMNEALMLLRRRRGVQEVLPEGAEEGGKSESEAFVDQSPSPEETCWRRERVHILTKAIRRLGPRISQAILLRDIEQRSLQETAKILGVSTTAVKARVFHGRRKLRSSLNRRAIWGGYGAVSRSA
jgi:RNA polymerase sigma-70 factor (ECF subfamily)